MSKYVNSKLYKTKIYDTSNVRVIYRCPPVQCRSSMTKQAEMNKILCVLCELIMQECSFFKIYDFT